MARWRHNSTPLHADHFFFQFLGYGKTFTMEQTMYHGGFLAIAMLGGVMGVNLSGSK